MGLLDYFNFTPRDRRVDARDRPLGFSIREFLRSAAIMALVLTVLDVLPALAYPTSPATRLQFIILWSLLMASFNLLVNRALLARRSYSQSR